MTLKQKATWFVGLPVVAVIFWTVLALGLFAVAPDRSTNPYCNLPLSDRTDMSADACAGDLLGYTTAAVLMLNIVSAALLLVGAIIFILAVVMSKIKRKAEKITVTS